MNSIRANSDKLLNLMAKLGGKEFTDKFLKAESMLERQQIVDAVDYLEELGAVERYVSPPGSP